MNIDEPAMKAIVAKAIFDSITPEQRTSLLQSAIADLLNTGKTETRNYQIIKVPSALEEIFVNEVRNMARDIVKESLAKDDAMRTLISASISKALAKMGETFELSDEIALAITAAFKKANSDRY